MVVHIWDYRNAELQPRQPSCLLTASMHVVGANIPENMGLYVLLLPSASCFNCERNVIMTAAK